MQAVSDPFLGWVPVANKDFYLRQVRDMKGKGLVSFDAEIYLSDVEVCGGTLGRAHARSLDPSLLCGYLGRSVIFSNGTNTENRDESEAYDDEGALEGRRFIPKAY